MYNLTPGHTKRLLGLLAKMREKVTLKSHLALYVIKHIYTIKLIGCVHVISNCGQAYVTISDY